MDAPSTTASRSSDRRTTRRKRVVVVDDISEILLAAINELGRLVPEFEVIPFHYNLSGIYERWEQDPTRIDLLTWTPMEKELLQKLENEKPDYILMDWGYSVKVLGGSEKDSPWYTLTTQKASSLNRNALNLLIDESQENGLGVVGTYLSQLEQPQCPNILIYTFNPFNAGVFEQLAETQDKLDLRFIDQKLEGRRPSFQYIETSAFFKHPKVLSLYRGWHEAETVADKVEGRKEIGTTKQLRQYGELLAIIFRDYLTEHEGGVDPKEARKRIFDIENLRFVRYQQFVSNRLGTIEYLNAAQEQSKIKLKLGALTYFDAGGDILLDIPRKDYYDSLDKWSERDDFQHLLSGADKEPHWKKDAKNFLYLRIYVRPKVASTDKLEFLLTAHQSNIELSNLQVTKLASLLFSCIYYYCESTFDTGKRKWVPSDDEVRIAAEIDLRDWLNNAEDQKLTAIDLFFLCQEIKNDDGTSGWVNYTLYNENEKPDIESLEAKEIESIVHRIMFDIRPAVIAKAKDALLPQLLDQIKREAMRAGVSRVMGRSLSHTHGSNSFQRLSQPGVLRGALDAPGGAHGHGAALIKAIEERVAKSNEKGGRPKANDLVASLAVIAKRLREQPIITQQAEEKLRGLFAYVKDRMELLAQVATTRSGLLEAQRLDLVFADYDSMRLLTDHMVTERFKITDVRCPSTEWVGFVEGTIGKSALFSVVEGIVRNANRHTDLEVCELTVTAEQCPRDHLIKVTIGHQWMPRTPQKVALTNIRAHLEKDMLDGKGGIRRGGWGLLEMKLACAFLREYDLVEVDDKKISPPLLTVEALRVTRKPYLNYVLYLPMPRDFVVARPKEDGTIGYHSPNGEVGKKHVKRFPIIGVQRNTTLDLAVGGLPARRGVIDTDKSDEVSIWKAYWSQHFGDVAVQVALFNEGGLVTSDNGGKASVVVGVGPPTLVCAIHNHVKTNGAQARVNHRTVMEQVIGGAHFKHLVQPIKDELCSGSRGTWAYRLAEAALTPIVVLDERIQIAAEHSVHSEGDDLYALFSRMGIYVPKRKEVDLDNPVHAHLVKYLKGIRAIKWHEKVPARYLVVHRTVLEKLSDKVRAETPGAYVDNHFKGFVTRWTSGASAGEGVGQLNQVYVPFAMVERNTIGYPCKWQLTDMMIRASQL